MPTSTPISTRMSVHYHPLAVTIVHGHSSISDSCLLPTTSTSAINSAHTIRSPTASMLAAFVAAVMASGGIVTHMFSQLKYTRYARKPGDQVLAQLVMVSLVTIVVACVRIVCTSCAAQLYPKVEKLLWQLYVFLDAARCYEYRSGARAGIPIASLAFISPSMVGHCPSPSYHSTTNIRPGMVVVSNAVVDGSIDLAALPPRYFTTSGPCPVRRVSIISISVHSEISRYFQALRSWRVGCNALKARLRRILRHIYTRLNRETLCSTVIVQLIIPSGLGTTYGIVFVRH